MKKNIAIIVPSLSGGGAERVASILSKYFSHENNVFLFLEKYDARKSYPYSGKIDYYPDEKIQGSIVDQIKIILKKAVYVKELKKKYNIDVAISFMEEANYINILSKRKEKVILRVCTILSERKEEFKEKAVYKRWLLQFIYNMSDYIVVMTGYAKMDLIKQWGIKEKIIKIIENPLDFKYIENSLQEQGDWEYGNNVVVSISRLDTVKRQWHLIKAFSIVHKYVPNAKLLFVGDGSCKNRLKVLAEKYRLEDYVIFVGHQNNVYPFIKNSKVFVLSSKTEGFPNGMIEALYIGIPVISSDCPGAPKEILAGKYTSIKTIQTRYLKYGILIPNFIECKDNIISKEEKEFAKAVINVINNPQSFCYYKNCAKKYVQRYELDYIGNKWDKIIN